MQWKSKLASIVSFHQWMQCARVKLWNEIDTLIRFQKKNITFNVDGVQGNLSQLQYRCIRLFWWASMIGCSCQRSLSSVIHTQCNDRSTHINTLASGSSPQKLFYELQCRLCESLRLGYDDYCAIYTDSWALSLSLWVFIMTHSLTLCTCRQYTSAWTYLGNSGIHLHTE